MQILKWQYSLFLEIEFLLDWQPLLERKNCLPAILFTWQHTCWNNWKFFNDNRIGYQRYHIKIKLISTLFFLLLLQLFQVFFCQSDYLYPFTNKYKSHHNTSSFFPLFLHFPWMSSGIEPWHLTFGTWTFYKFWPNARPNQLSHLNTHKLGDLNWGFYIQNWIN